MVRVSNQNIVYVLAALLSLFGCDNKKATEEHLGKIDRKALVSRHNVMLNEPDTLGSLTVGNGEFAYTVDVSGLQSFHDVYEKGVSLGTQSQWGWHVIPTDQNYRVEEVYRYDTSCTGQVIPFPVQHSDGRKGEATHWLRTNPHRLHLGLIGLEMIKEDGTAVEVQDLQNIHQELDLWTGKIESQYEIEGVPVRVELYSHQEMDQISAKVSSPLIRQGRLNVFLKFPYGSGCHVCPGYDWDNADMHHTSISAETSNHAQLKRHLDTTIYYTEVKWYGEGRFHEKERHHFELIPDAKEESLTFSVLFSKTPNGDNIRDFKTTQRNSQEQWEEFWTTGGAIDFSGSTDPRASELERRVVLSQYLTKVNCSGSLPPQETGLTMNSWYGKFHIEMHWWHGVHFALWDRISLLEKGLPWYFEVLPKAKATAQLQGFEGARWQKMTDPYGDESPSGIAPYLIWQQPHIIYFAELIYRQDPSKEVLEKFKTLIFESADFMASFAQYNPEDQLYHLCAPLIPAQELFPANEANDPPFELAYWHYGLSLAQQWRKRLGMEENAQWQNVIDNLAPLPQSNDLYYPSASHPTAYADDFYRRDHPVVLGALGCLPLSEMIDTAIMKNTLREIMSSWQWETTWGWDYPMTAMNAARLGLPEMAIEALLMNVQKNTYLVNGHNYQDDRLRIYLPGNGGLLTTVAMMAAGWDGAPEKHAPGFPDNGKWKVRWEGLHKMP